MNSSMLMALILPISWCWCVPANHSSDYELTVDLFRCFYIRHHWYALNNLLWTIAPRRCVSQVFRTLQANLSLFLDRR